MGYTHNDSNQLAPETAPLFQQFGLNGIPPGDALTGLPNIAVTGFSSLGDNTFLPNPKLVQVDQFNDTVSWQHGKHSFTFGGQLILTHNFAGTSSNARSTLNFNGQFTSRVPGKGSGSAVADLLLGQTSSATISTYLIARFRNRYAGAFANDTWRVTPKLTLNLGLRYDLQTPMWDRDNRLANFNFAPGSPGFGTLVTAQAGDIQQRSFSSLDTNNFAPRIGIAYQVNSKTVVRSAFGIFYGGLGFQAIAQTGAANPPFFYSVPLTSSTNAAVSNLVLANGFPSGVLTPSRVQNPNVFAISSNYPMPAVEQWNFAIERQLPSDSILKLGYVGNSASHLMADNNFNAPVPGPGATNARRPFTQYGELFYQSPTHTPPMRAFRSRSRSATAIRSRSWRTIPGATLSITCTTMRTIPVEWCRRIQTTLTPRRRSLDSISATDSSRTSSTTCPLAGLASFWETILWDARFSAAGRWEESSRLRAGIPSPPP